MWQHICRHRLCHAGQLGDQLHRVGIPRGSRRKQCLHRRRRDVQREIPGAFFRGGVQYYGRGCRAIQQVPVVFRDPAGLDGDRLRADLELLQHHRVANYVGDPHIHGRREELRRPVSIHRLRRVQSRHQQILSLGQPLPRRGQRFSRELLEQSTLVMSKTLGVLFSQSLKVFGTRNTQCLLSVGPHHGRVVVLAQVHERRVGIGKGESIIADGFQPRGKWVVIVALIVPIQPVTGVPQVGVGQIATQQLRVEGLRRPQLTPLEAGEQSQRGATLSL